VESYGGLYCNVPQMFCCVPLQAIDNKRMFQCSVYLEI
jgi:hypothetical protein